MRLLTTAVLEWFGDGCCDVKYLDIWNDTPRTYIPSQIDDSEWQIDHYETLLCANCDQQQFQRAADLLMRYRIYPPSMIAAFGDFDLAQGRWLAVGDRIVQRIHLLRLFGRPVLDVVGMAEISQVVSTPRSYGFTCITAVPHMAQGKWTICLIWQDNGDLVLKIDALSRPSPQEPPRSYAIMNRLMQKAHQSGIARFEQMLHH